METPTAPAKADASTTHREHMNSSAARAPTEAPDGQAQHIRVGQRIAQQRLHHHAGQRQRGARDKGGQRAAQAQVEQGGGKGIGLALDR